MKLLYKITLLLVLLTTVASCERDYDAPPLNEPIYDGSEANITIAALKEAYKGATDKAPITIEDNLILKAYITGNDESGNIYKQIYIQDETGAMPILVDQGDVYNFYRRGQEVYIDLKGMCVSVYGDEQQLGWPLASDTYYRMPFTTFQEKIKQNKWANENNVTPLEISDISSINTDVAKMTFRLVKLVNVEFENAGNATFAGESGYGEATIKDANGNTITIRTSSYADFASKKLPTGKGNVIGILGRFRGAWQLTIPRFNDMSGFDKNSESGNNPSTSDDNKESVIFSETFGTPTKDGTDWPYVKDCTSLDNPISMFDGNIDKLSVRLVGTPTDGSVWYRTGYDNSLIINGIDAKDATTATLIFNVGANVYSAGESTDLNTLKVKCNGTELTVPSKVVSGDDKQGNIPFELKIENIPVTNSTSLEFYTTKDINKYGLRLYDIKLVTTTSTSGNTSSDNNGGTLYPESGK